jgi:hypothetical protein
MSSSTLFELKKSPMNFCIVFRGALTKQQKLIEHFKKQNAHRCNVPWELEPFSMENSLFLWKVVCSQNKFFILWGELAWD